MYLGFAGISFGIPSVFGRLHDRVLEGLSVYAEALLYWPGLHVRPFSSNVAKFLVTTRLKGIILRFVFIIASRGPVPRMHRVVPVGVVF